MSFKELIGALGTLAKAQAIDGTGNDNKAGGAGGEGGNGNDGSGAGAGGTQVQTTAQGGAEGQGGSDGAGAAAQAAAAAGDGQATALVKSLAVTEVVVNGETFESMDAGEILKSLGGLAGHIDAQEGEIKQALGQAVMVMATQSQQISTLTKSLSDQGDLVKSLRADLDAFRAAPAGRKGVTNPAGVSAAAPLIKSLGQGDAGEGMQPQEFLAKCLTLQKDGKLSLQEVAYAEAAIGSGAAVPESITSKVFSTK